MDKEKRFNIGDRCYFNVSHGIGSFGNIISIDHNNTRLLIRTDDGEKFEAWASEVTILNTRKDK